MTALRVCATCRFYEELYETDFGACHLSPPVVGSSGRDYWPPVAETDWCGQWSPDDWEVRAARREARKAVDRIRKEGSR